ncbi:uncharacterized protein EKO05_0002762 [Ascochyta rabiei]|uniref:uncharacterized protein n=1 Tax=Didymella rabiei TaxID=5454 RepID=UPI0021FEB624|nr:uncharacterized protein EKO05_0002762 [Ascochyta rabiei]UPX12199.1 hypothetical protein EKO05_0002762 [Ascochyta rabiei]
MCFLALSTTYFGIKHHKMTVTSLGLRRYGAALQAVHEALADDNVSRIIDVIEAVMIMAVIELLVSERKNEWIQHARGFERLLQKRGPKRMSSLPSLLVLGKCRALMIFGALMLRKPTIVASSEWKTLPWAQFPHRINSLKLLTNIMADYLETFVIRDQIGQTQMQRGDHHIQVQPLLTKAQSILHNLHQWRTHPS